MDLIRPSEKNVFILGAGFSRTAGLPLIYDFLANSRKAISWLEENGRESEKEAILEVFRYRMKSSSAGYYSTINLENIEELFSLASSDPDSGMDENIRLTITSTLDYCSKYYKQRKIYLYKNQSIGIAQDQWAPLSSTKLGHLLTPSKPEESVHYKFTEYQYFLSIIMNLFNNKISEDSIITFNYDLLIEEACKELNVEIDYAIHSNYVELDHREHKHGNPKLRLLKLHGSLNWAKKENKVEIFDDYDPAFTKGKKVPFLIPPTWRKDMIGPLEDVWRSAIDELKHASNIVFIGFSMPETDIYVRYLLALGLKENVHLNKIIFVNPLKHTDEQNSMMQRIKSKFGDQIFRLNIFCPFWVKTDEFFIDQLKFAAGYSEKFPFDDRKPDLNQYDLQIRNN